MKRILGISLMLASLGFYSGTVEYIYANTAQQESVTYACPMHPEEKSTSPATCSKCGMKLEKVTKK